MFGIFGSFTGKIPRRCQSIFPTSTAGFSGGGLLVSTADCDGRPGLPYQSNRRQHRRRDGCGPLTVRDRCVHTYIDAAIGMAQDSTTTTRPPFTFAPVVFR